MTTINDIEQLFRSNYKAMLVLANRLLHDEDAARDIVHDVFATLLSGGADQATPAYLLRGVRFACMKHIRSMGARERLGRLYAADFMEIEEETWPDEETIAKLNETVDSLPEQTMRVVILRFRAQLSYREIAEELGVSEVTVYKHLRHAINVLRKYFNEHEG